MSEVFPEASSQRNGPGTPLQEVQETPEQTPELPQMDPPAVKEQRLNSELRPGLVSVVVSRSRDVVVLTMTSDPSSVCPPLCQLLGALCYSPRCDVSQTVCLALLVFFGLLHIGLVAFYVGDRFFLLTLSVFMLVTLSIVNVCKALSSNVRRLMVLERGSRLGRTIKNTCKDLSSAVSRLMVLERGWSHSGTIMNVPGPGARVEPEWDHVSAGPG